MPLNAPQTEAQRRRIARLREVRAQEKRIANETRASFREEARQRQAFLLREVEAQWHAKHDCEREELDAVLQAQYVRVGQSHVSAISAKHEQHLEAVDNLAVWKQGCDHEQLRAHSALQQVGAAAAARQYASTGAAHRREHVREVEAERSALQVERKHASDNAEAAAVAAAEAAAAAAAAAPQLVARRCAAPVDYASSRSHTYSSPPKRRGLRALGPRVEGALALRPAFAQASVQP